MAGTYASMTEKIAEARRRIAKMKSYVKLDDTLARFDGMAVAYKYGKLRMPDLHGLLGLVDDVTESVDDESDGWLSAGAYAMVLSASQEASCAACTALADLAAASMDMPNADAIADLVSEACEALIHDDPQRAGQAISRLDAEKKLAAPHRTTPLDAGKADSNLGYATRMVRSLSPADAEEGEST